MADLNDSVTPLSIITPPSVTPISRPLPVREDCWSEEATSTLVDAWGRRYVELNRGNLRQKDWQDVADAVNALHGHTKKTHRTDVQCKNRIDTIKKKYKTEKARVTASNGTLTSSWPFFDRLDSLIGSNFSAKKLSPSPRLSPRLSRSPPVALPLPLPYRRTTTPASASVIALPQKRPASAVDDGYFKRNYSAMAAAAAAAAASAAAESDELEEEESEGEESEGDGEKKEGMKRLARAIESFGQVYERVEGEKLRQMVELEKQRMQFAKDLEVQRMRMFMDTQVQLQKIKRSKRSSGSSDLYS